MGRTGTRALLRSLRATALGGSVIALAAGAHAWAGADLPHPLILAALVAVTGLASTVLSRVMLRLPALMAVLGAGQLALHEAFAALAPTGEASPSSAAALGRGWHQHSGDALSALTSLDSGAAAASHSHSSPLMPMLHGGATVACALAIRGAERALELLAAWLRPLTRLPEPAAVVPPAPVLPAAPRAAHRVLPWRQLAPPPLRGPPPAPAFA
jgi:hypothetical protein